MTIVEPGQGTRDLAKKRVRHFLADFNKLESEFPSIYPKMIVRGDGPYVVDSDGHRILDAGTHLGACQVGHSRPEIADRMAEQTRTLEFIALDGGVSHGYAAELAERLAPLVQCDDPIFSFTGSGSESNELAFKIARQYHVRRGAPSRTKIISRLGSYHGSTIATSAAAGMAGFKTDFGPMPADFIQAPAPFPGGDVPGRDRAEWWRQSLAETQALIEAEGPETIAAIIAEPIAIPQAVKIPTAEYFTGLRSLCDSFGLLLIIDEVVCGFGRTGRMFGAEHFGVRGDIVSYAKGLTSGYVPMGAVAVSRQVEEVFAKQPLLHLNTYAGHPVGCAAAMAALDIMEDERLVENAATMEGVLKDELSRLKQAVGRTREISVIGLLSSVVCDISDVADPDAAVRRVRKNAYDAGVLARIGRDRTNLSAHFYPPLNVTANDVTAGVHALEVGLRSIDA
ncbi:taurine--pyruvate aminotransferase [Variibacter gotjawalensis]|uniref:Taurine--pyruvate aminotransferase n=1 Tax=Variibacter gotjawalensis TaxID=1333996 RepID=A0A0S3PU46_9BRAD|nr:aminotransferase class III-fold pyridoxal phosphate-dependent enzyme [Variibacter gotjawalensis]NIK49794.1 adenosylmethionine-8-amino-7-oxononanoate aminotransferase [Variibacter gotjawalensis]RZS45798.1 adenosylmethionine-8-amino-7-oxononanoate aminotransferase [Variibacter gotjawalensis]BAT59471.1 taurine--pyruvate aminotransferase [Variibacter gotjawalensis]